MWKVLRFIFKPIFFILVGVIMTVVSAFFTNYVIAENDTEIQDLQQEVQQIDLTIDSMWANANRFESNGNTAVLITLLASLGKAENLDKEHVSQCIRKVISRGSRGIFDDTDIHLNGNGEFVDTLLQTVNQQRYETIDTINDLYFDRIELEQEISAINHDNLQYKNIALFLQIMGLIFVLAKDIARK